MTRMLDELRLFTIMLMADIIIKLAPNTPEGDIWVIGIHGVANECISLSAKELCERADNV